MAAQSLRAVTDDFHEENNIIISVAKKMSQQMSQMAEFSYGRGELQVSNNRSMIHLYPSLSGIYTVWCCTGRVRWR